jgi:hypothetical protein
MEYLYKLDAVRHLCAILVTKDPSVLHPAIVGLGRMLAWGACPHLG